MDKQVEEYHVCGGRLPDGITVVLANNGIEYSGTLNFVNVCVRD